MFNAITHHSIFVLDQDEALAFYVGTLGLEVAEDSDLGFMRWLTVQAPGDPSHKILLEKPGPPSMDEATGASVRELLTKGASGLACILTTDDCQRTYDELRAKGVEFTEEPTKHFYGTDCALRDPFGNHVRISQPATGPIETPSPAELREEFTPPNPG